MRFLVDGTMGLSSGACARQLRYSRPPPCTHLNTSNDFDATGLSLQTPQHRLALQLHLIRATKEQNHVIRHKRRVEGVVSRQRRQQVDLQIRLEPRCADHVRAHFAHRRQPSLDLTLRQAKGGQQASEETARRERRDEGHNGDDSRHGQTSR